MARPLRNVPLVVGLACAANLLLAAPRTDATGGRDQTGMAPAVPVLVELFTAEGCSSCPPADVLLDKMLESQPAAGATLVGLGEHVDYWNQSGWKDRFSSSAFTRRQQQYAARSGGDNVYTPEMVIDGGDGFVGTDIDAARRAIEHAITLPHGTVRLALDRSSQDKGKIAVSIEVSGLPTVDRGDPADLVVAVTEDRLRTEVKRGENQGRSLTHAAVVREMQIVADVTGPDRIARATFAIAPDWRSENLTIVSFIQQRRSRLVIGTAALPLQKAR